MQILNLHSLCHTAFVCALVTVFVRNLLVATSQMIMDATRFEPCYEPLLLLAVRDCLRNINGALGIFLTMSHLVSALLVHTSSGELKIYLIVAK